MKNNLQFNSEMSAKYGLHIYNSENKNFPFYVEEWDDCYTEEEIEAFLPDHRMIVGIQFEDEA